MEKSSFEKKGGSAKAFESWEEQLELFSITG